MHLRGPPRRERQPSSVSYGPDFLIITGLNIVMHVPSLSNTIIRLRTPIIFAAIPTQPSLLAISVSNKFCVTCKSSFVAIYDLPARNSGSCTTFLIMLLISKTIYCIVVIISFNSDSSVIRQTKQASFIGVVFTSSNCLLFSH